MISAKSAVILAKVGRVKLIEKQMTDISERIRYVATRGERSVECREPEIEVLRELDAQGFKVSHCITGLGENGIKIEW